MWKQLGAAVGAVMLVTGAWAAEENANQADASDDKGDTRDGIHVSLEEAPAIAPLAVVDQDGVAPVAVSYTILSENLKLEDEEPSALLNFAFWEDGRVAGISAAGHNVSHLVSLAQNIVDDAWDRDRAEKLVFAHPTLDESLKEALLAEPAG